MGDSKKIHPAITINNIKNFIPITLELTTGQYSAWSELFQIHCTAFQVIDHIIPPTDTQSSTTTATNTSTKPPDWSRLDAVVKQWIYSTISNDLLLTILTPGSTAQETWDRLKNIFHDNQHSRSIHLMNQFSNTRLDAFSSVSAYCQELKQLCDQINQLSDNNSRIEENRLVLQLITGLNDSYDAIGSILAHRKPLPSFYEARSMLILEETRKSKQLAYATSTANTALVTTTPATPRAPSLNQTQIRNYSNRGRGNSRGNFRGRGNTGRGRGRSSYNSNPNSSGQNASQWGYAPWAWQNQQSAPPCPYPSMPWVRPNNNNQPGILGPRPQQSYAHSVQSTPTDIEEALHAMSLNPPDDNWYLDTGATSHMTGTQGLSEGDQANAVQQHR
ncbi:uncharacterized protein [Rutidosis leptorrhynchoides]|uniref:uncharacterized protein n=1 Tax=Rutidosis leptorrhynchoides TaxID=125765 RepID=UPI003A9A55CB